ncbi:hypothetical protein [Pseudomonas sp.]|uniref:hypothetical protein n=1 Tax=Pseudomonas sp. TaxID=306 RepID=UPI002634A8E1|nr:hypothetical protein [Pseudomonas sp.]
MAAGDVHLDYFKIELPSGHLYTDELYANARHQCQVVLTVLKLVEDENGSLVGTPLTQTEIDSAEITAYGATAAPLPPGWHCDTWKNKYLPGLWKQGVDIQPESAGSEPVLPCLKSDPKQSIARYMRFDSGRGVEMKRFMGRIVVGGKVYTTNSSHDGVIFNSYVDIQPTLPYRLSVAQMAQYVDFDAFNGKVAGDFVDIDIYYWMPPAGLEFLDNFGLDRTVYVNYDGLKFDTSFVFQAGHGIRKKGGVVMGTGSTRVYDIHRGAAGGAGGGDQYVRTDLYPTIMRAARYSGWMDTPDGETASPWRLQDNYGCDHVFSIGWGDNRNLLELRG